MTPSIHRTNPLRATPACDYPPECCESKEEMRKLSSKRNRKNILAYVVMPPRRRSSLTCSSCEAKFIAAYRGSRPLCTLCRRATAPFISANAAHVTAAVRAEMDELLSRRPSHAAAEGQAVVHVERLLDLQEELLVMIACLLQPQDWVNFAEASKGTNAVAEGSVEAVLGAQIGRRLLNRMHASHCEARLRHAMDALCRRWPAVVVPLGISTICDSAFKSCALMSITLHEGVTVIDRFAFYLCFSLTAATLPRSLTMIGEHAFANCSNLTSIILPEGLSRIHQRTFYACSALASISLPESITAIDDYAFAGCSSLTSIALPGALVTISKSTFSRCSKLNSVALPASITTIDQYAFQGCSAITSFTLPAELVRISYGAFFDCTGLDAEMQSAVCAFNPHDDVRAEALGSTPRLL